MNIRQTHEKWTRGYVLHLSPGDRSLQKFANNFPLLPRIFNSYWGAACYSCSWFYSVADPSSRASARVIADSILRLTWVPVAGYELRLSRVSVAGYKLQLTPSYGWLEFWQLDTSCGWFILRLTRAPATGYDLRLIPSCSWLRVAVDSSFGDWIRVIADSILQLTRAPATGYNLRLIPSCGWLWVAIDSSSAS